MPPAKRFHGLGQEDLDRLLAWLDPDLDRAGVLYEKIRWRIVAILAARGCSCPEELADETIDRVARRVADIQETYVGEKAIYFLAVANNVHHEYLKRPTLAALPESHSNAAESRNKEETHQCLESCLEKLPLDARSLIERYYAEEKQAKIDLRKRIADELGIGPGTLRLRALRIRERLQQCIEICLDA